MSLPAVILEIPYPEVHFGRALLCQRPGRSSAAAGPFQLACGRSFPHPYRAGLALCFPQQSHRHHWKSVTSNCPQIRPLATFPFNLNFVIEAEVFPQCPSNPLHYFLFSGYITNSKVSKMAFFDKISVCSGYRRRRGAVDRREQGRQSTAVRPGRLSARADCCCSCEGCGGIPTDPSLPGRERDCPGEGALQIRWN